MNYDYLIKSSIKELQSGINFIINEIIKRDATYTNEYMIIYCEKLLECTFNKFRNDDFEYLQPCIVNYKGNFKFIPIELKSPIESLLVFYKQFKEKNIENNKIKVKK